MFPGMDQIGELATYVKDWCVRIEEILKNIEQNSDKSTITLVLSRPELDVLRKSMEVGMEASMKARKNANS